MNEGSSRPRQPGRSVYETGGHRFKSCRARWRKPRELRQGNPETGTTVKPGSVLFSAKAANSFTFGVGNNCLPEHEIQWKRVGKRCLFITGLFLKPSDLRDRVQVVIFSNETGVNRLAP